MSAPAVLRIVIVAPDSLTPDPADGQAHWVAEAERSRSLRIGLLEHGYNIVAVLPADVFLPERLIPSFRARSKLDLRDSRVPGGVGLPALSVLSMVALAVTVIDSAIDGLRVMVMSAF